MAWLEGDLKLLAAGMAVGGKWNGPGSGSGGGGSGGVVFGEMEPIELNGFIVPQALFGLLEET